jgi:hypothetical protein
MKKVMLPVLKFKELKSAIQEVLIDEEHNNECQDRQHFTEMCTDSMTENLEGWGLPTEDLEYRLSYSQGDGVAFYGEIDMERLSFLTKEQKEMLGKFEYFTVTIYRNQFGHHYSHSKTMELDVDYDFVCKDMISKDVTKMDDFAEELEQEILEYVRTKSRELETYGYEYFYPDLDDVDYKEGITSKLSADNYFINGDVAEDDFTMVEDSNDILLKINALKKKYIALVVEEEGINEFIPTKNV